MKKIFVVISLITICAIGIYMVIINNVNKAAHTNNLINYKLKSELIIKKRSSEVKMNSDSVKVKCEKREHESVSEGLLMTSTNVLKKSVNV